MMKHLREQESLTHSQIIQVFMMFLEEAGVNYIIKKELPIKHKDELIFYSKEEIGRAIQLTSLELQQKFVSISDSAANQLVLLGATPEYTKGVKDAIHLYSKFAKLLIQEILEETEVKL